MNSVSYFVNTNHTINAKKKLHNQMQDYIYIHNEIKFRIGNPNVK